MRFFRPGCGPQLYSPVTKTKPSALLQAAYDAGQRDFGENYVQEVVQKGPELPPDLRWHFIGHLQSNKSKLITSDPPLQTHGLARWQHCSSQPEIITNGVA